MPEGVTAEEKAIIRRVVPKAQNKILAAAMVRLYIAYPNTSKWTYTGLQGAVVLANDLIGNTFWLKLVDVSPSVRGVIWDQEIYENWSYNQDRVFFHSFEIEGCLAGLSFSEEKEAVKFLKQMVDREKHASKATKLNPFGGSGPAPQKHGILGGIFGGHRHVSAPSAPMPSQPTPPESPRTFIPPSLSQHNPSYSSVSINPPKVSEYAKLDALDPNWRETWGGDLRDMGITDDQIRDNQDFIAEYIQEQQAASAAAPEPAYQEPPRAKTALPPRPPPSPAADPRIHELPQSPPPPPAQRGAPPAPPPSRRAKAEPIPKEPTPPPREPSPPKGPPPPKYAAPPPFADAGKLLNSNPRPTPGRPHATSISNQSAPPRPPRPPKTPNDDFEPGESGSRFGVPPPFMGQRTPQPPPTPMRSAVPPPPPARSTPNAALPPPLPPKTPNNGPGSPPAPPPSSSRPIPPPPSRDNGPPPPPPLP
ncbi:hypothetical protein VE04_03782, partial [Pseudogymnoascus sp. 24MN13]